MMLSKEEIKKIAILARIDLSPEEEARHAETISAVLGYIQLLNEIDTSAVEPTYQVTGLSGVFRQDKAEKSLIKKELIDAMPNVKNKLLQVPDVFKKEDNAH